LYIEDIEPLKETINHWSLRMDHLHMFVTENRAGITHENPTIEPQESEPEQYVIRKKGKKKQV